MNIGLLGEGFSDRALVPILRWILRETTDRPLDVRFIDRGLFPERARTLAEKVELAVRFGPWDLLFIHRDSDGQPVEWRSAEIASAAGKHAHVAVVPVRMTEAWLLHSEPAIRAAAGRPSGAEPLTLPPVKRIETLPDPKEVLREALTTAHAATGRRARQFEAAAAVHRVADLIEDWRPLRALPAFQRLEADAREALVRLGVPVGTPPV